MNRSTRLVTRLNSPELHRFFAGTVGFGSSHPQKTLTRTHILLSSPRLFEIGSFATNSFNRRKEHRKKLNPPHRRELPEELSRNVVVLTCKSTVKGGSCDVYLIGTYHDSQESCKEVKAVIQFLKPQVVFLESCDRRKDEFTSQDLSVRTMGNMDVKEYRHSEFRVAFEEARAYGGKVVLGDRPYDITYWRAWARMHLWLKLKFICLKRFQVNPLLHDCTYEIIVHERDHSVVAVVGKGHLQGINYWKQPIEEKQLRELHQIPSDLEGGASPLVLLRVAKLLGVTMAATAIVSYIYFRC